MISPFPWQVPNVNAMVRAISDHGVCFDNSPTGSGKTYQAIFAAQELNLIPVVVCTVSVLDYWRDVASQIGHPASNVVNYEALLASTKVTKHITDETGAVKTRRPSVNRHKHPSPHPLGGWQFVNREWFWTLPPDSLLICDEAHRLSGMTSKSNRFLKAAVDQEIPTLCLSATLAESPLKMRAIAYACKFIPTFSTLKFKSWCQLHGCDYIDAWQLAFIGDHSHMEEIRKNMGPRLTGIKLSEIPNFPKSNVMVLSVPVDKNPDDVYSKDLTGLQDAALTAGVHSLRARQISEWGKRKWILSRANDLREEGLSIAIFISFKATGEWLAKQLKCPFISGDTKATREQDIKRFQSNEIDCLVLMIQAGAESISLHDLHGKPRATIISPNYNAIQLIQALGRTPRAESKQKSVPQYVIFAKGSAVESRIATNVRGKIRNLNALTDNDLMALPPTEKNLEKTLAMPTDFNHDPTAMEKDATAVDKNAHAPVGPSKLKYLDQCPHFEQDQDDTPHENTTQGNQVHLLNELYFSGKSVDDLTSEEKALLVDVPEAVVKRAEWCQDYADAEIQKHFGSSYKLLVEPRLKTEFPNTWGRADLVVLGRHGKAAMFDWKDGQGYQGDAETNLQGWAYLLGLLNGFEDIQEVTVYFVYSRLEQVTFSVFKRDSIGPIQKRIAKINNYWERAQAGEQLHNRGDACEWCSLQPDCPAWQALVPAVSERLSPSVQNMLPSTWKLSELSERPEEMAKALRVMNFFSKWFAEAKTLGKQMIEEDDLDLPGWKLINSNSGITCTDAEGAYETAVVEAGLHVEDFLECVGKMHPGKLITALAARTASVHGTKAKAAKHWRKVLLETGVIKDGTEFSYIKIDKSVESDLGLLK